MKKEDLIAMGLTEEQATALIDKYGNMIPKERFDEVNDAKKNLEKQINDRDTQLKELQDKAKGNEDLTKQIQELQDANKQAKADYDKQLKDVQLSTAIKLAIATKAQDADIVTGLIDASKIELNEDGSIKGGLDEQLKTLQESKPFLFVPENPGKPKGTKTPEGGSPGGEGDTEGDFGKKVADLSKTNEGLEKARNSYFE